MKRQDGPWKVHPYREPAEVPEKKELPKPSVIDRLIEKSNEYYEAHFVSPKVAKVGSDVYRGCLGELRSLQRFMMPPYKPITGSESISVATPTGYLLVVLDPGLAPDMILLLEREMNEEKIKTST